MWFDSTPTVLRGRSNGYTLWDDHPSRTTVPDMGTAQLVTVNNCSRPVYCKVPQLVEDLTVNQGYVGSTPALAVMNRLEQLIDRLENSDRKGNWADFQDAAKTIRSLRDLVQELLDEPMTNHCADEGTHCIFCWEEIRYYPHETVHSEKCWRNRAKAALGL